MKEKDVRREQERKKKQGIIKEKQNRQGQKKKKRQA